MSPIQIRFGGYQPPASVHGRAAARLTEALALRLGHAAGVDLDGDIVASGRPAAELFALVERGEMTMGYFSTSYLARRVPEFALLDLPFAFDRPEPRTRSSTARSAPTSLRGSRRGPDVVRRGGRRCCCGRRAAWSILPAPRGRIALPEVPDIHTDIHTYYGDSYVLQGVSLRVDRRQIVGILGRNGMGKTTLIRSIIGFTKARYLGL